MADIFPQTPACSGTAVSDEASVTVLTIGHSTRTVDEFISLLVAYGARRLVDVRTVPRSRHNPQFNRDALPVTLAAHGIGYTHMPGLGGLRHPKAGSPNSGWRNDSFRGFADYMQTDDFGASMEKLVQLGRDELLAVMCAEAVPWRCHRSLIADSLLVRGVGVFHIMGRNSLVAHELTPFARVNGITVTYPLETHDDRGLR